MASFQDRVIGALKLQPNTFEKSRTTRPRRDKRRSVIAAAISGGGRFDLVGTLRFGSAITGSSSASCSLVGWGVGSWVLLMVGTR
jgi:hypothetical protein